MRVGEGTFERPALCWRISWAGVRSTPGPMRWMTRGVDRSRGHDLPLLGVKDKGGDPDYRFRTGGVEDLILDRIFSSALPRLFLPVPSLPAPQNESTGDICVFKNRRTTINTRACTLDCQLTNVMWRSPVSSIIFLRLLCWVNLCQSTTSIYSRRVSPRF